MKKPTLVENRLTARRQADPLIWTSTPVRLERTILRGGHDREQSHP